MKLCVRAHDLGVKDIDPITAKIKALGLDGIQLVAYKSFSDVAYEPGSITEEKAEKIGKLLQMSEIEIPLIGAYFNPVHSNREKEKKCEQIFGDYLHVAKKLGSAYVGSETGSYNDDKWTYHPMNRTDEAREEVVKVFSRLAVRAQQESVNIAMEGAAGHVCYAPSVLKQAIHEIGAGNIKVIFDLYNYLDGSNEHNYPDILEEGLEIFKGDILLFHLKDFNFSDDGSRPVQVPFGQGQLDKKRVLSRIREYDENAVLVFEGTTAEYLEDAVKCVRDIW